MIVDRTRHFGFGAHFSVLAALTAMLATTAPADAQSLSGASTPQNVAGAASAGPFVAVELRFVAYNSPAAPGDLPFDLMDALRSVPGITGMPRDSQGRFPTWGLAYQSTIEEFELRGGGHTLKLKNGELSIAPPDGAAAAGSPWNIIAAPRIVLAIGQNAGVSVGQAVPFLVRGDDGCLRVERADDLLEGIRVDLRAARIEDGGIRFEDIKLKLSRVVSRQPLEDVPLDVGRPVIDSRETALNITVDNGNVGIIPLPMAEGEPPLLVLITAQKVDALP